MQLEPRSGRPRRMVLLRHGRTAWNKIGRAQGHADVSLDQVGRRQAKHAAGQLVEYKPAVVWSSDLARARETAQQLAVLTGHDLVIDKRLREYDVGARQGLTFDEFQAKFPELYTASRSGDRVTVPGAESDEEVAERMVAVLRDIADSLGAHDTAIVVGHGAALRTGLLAFFGVSHARDMLAGMANCAWTVVEQHANRGWQIVDYNAQTLPPALELADDLH